MSTSPPKAPRSLADFGEVLRDLLREGFDVTVIGGCAVSAYAHLLGEPLYSTDLDLYSDRETLEEILRWAPTRGMRVLKRPKPRNLPVAVLHTADDLEINILTQSSGLPTPELVARTARLMTVSASGGVEVLVAEPLDLLANKLALQRPKDRPHIEILRRFVEDEAIQAFVDVEQPRDRRLLDVLGRRLIPKNLADRLIELADIPPDFRFLAHRVPSGEQARHLQARAATRAGNVAKEIEAILASRHLGEDDQFED